MTQTHYITATLSLSPSLTIFLFLSPSHPPPPAPPCDEAMTSLDSLMIECFTQISEETRLIFVPLINHLVSPLTHRWMRTSQCSNYSFGIHSGAGKVFYNESILPPRGSTIVAVFLLTVMQSFFLRCRLCDITEFLVVRAPPSQRHQSVRLHQSAVSPPRVS